MADNVFYCDNCGGIMEFDVKTQMLKCPNCDTTVEIANRQEDIIEHTLTNHAIQTLRCEQKTSTTMECSGCGAKIEVEGHQASVNCPYCGSNYVLAEKQEEVIIPDGVVPFQIDRNRAKEILGTWLKKRWLAPGELKNMYQRGDLFGIYVPFWTFDADGRAEYTAFGGKYRTEHYRDKDGNMHTRTVTDWYPTRGSVRRFFDDVLVQASRRQSETLMSGVEDFDTKKLMSYAPDYFSGYGVETFHVNLDEAHSRALGIMQNDLRELARQDVLKRYDTAKDVHIHANFSKETYKHILLPLYTVTYHYKDKLYHVLINGQNGRIHGEYPKSVIKIVLILIAVAALLMGVIFLGTDRGTAQSYRSSGAAIENIDEATYICYDDKDVIQYEEV